VHYYYWYWYPQADEKWRATNLTARPNIGTEYRVSNAPVVISHQQ
jgi:hypothetical protein